MKLNIDQDKPILIEHHIVLPKISKPKMQTTIFYGLILVGLVAQGRIVKAINSDLSK